MRTRGLYRVITGSSRYRTRTRSFYFRYTIYVQWMNLSKNTRLRLSPKFPTSCTAQRDILCLAAGKDTIEENIEPHRVKNQRTSLPQFTIHNLNLLKPIQHHGIDSHNHILTQQNSRISFEQRSFQCKPSADLIDDIFLGSEFQAQNSSAIWSPYSTTTEVIGIEREEPFESHNTEHRRWFSISIREANFPNRGH